MSEMPATRIDLMHMDEFIHRYDQDGPFELIDGELIPKMPSISEHNQTAKRIFLAFLPYEQQGLGEVFQEATFVLTDNPDWVRGSRIPGVMFVSAKKLARFKQTVPDYQNKPYILIPDIAVEVVAPTDQYSVILQKVKRYLKDGVSIVLVVDPQLREIIVHRLGSQQQITLNGNDDILTLEPVLPGFAVKLWQIFG